MHLAESRGTIYLKLGKGVKGVAFSKYRKRQWFSCAKQYLRMNVSNHSRVAWISRAITQ